MSGRERRPRYLRAEVRSRLLLGPDMVRIRFGGGDLRRFTATEQPDQRVIIAFPQPGHDEPPRPVDGAFRDGPDQPVLRSYTVRAWDPSAAELVVDFALHATGVATEWARHAATGAVVYVHADAGWYRPPADTAHWILLADLAGLPTLTRIVEMLPPGAPTDVCAAVPHPGDIPAWRPAAAISAMWLVGDDAPLLVDAVAQIAPPTDPVYVWSATEASVARAIRKHVRGTWNLPAQRCDVVGYWRAAQEEWLARYHRVEAQMTAVWQAALDEGKSEDDAADIYDAALESAGL